MAKVTPKFYGEVGKTLKLYDPDRFGKWMRKLEGKQVVVVIEELQDSRGLNQLRYLWGAVYQIIEDDTGTPSEDIHEYCKARFLGRIIEIKGKEVKVPGTTKNLTWEEMETFTKRVRSWAQMELGLVIPARGEITLS